MNICLKLRVAGLTCAVLADGTIAAKANPDPVDIHAPTIDNSGPAIVFALNAQPLPPSMAATILTSFAVSLERCSRFAL